MLFGYIEGNIVLRHPFPFISYGNEWEREADVVKEILGRYKSFTPDTQSGSDFGRIHLSFSRVCKTKFSNKRTLKDGMLKRC